VTAKKRELCSLREELFVQLVFEMGVARARTLVEAVALMIRKARHAKRERPKFQERRRQKRPVRPRGLTWARAHIAAALRWGGGQPGQRRGFAAMDSKRVSEISALGGRAAHARGTAHEYSKREAEQAGRKGGFSTAKNRRRSS